MANPQVENGHIKIARELWDNYCKFRIPGEVRQVVDVVIRKTYGWQKKEDVISLTQFAEMAGLKKPNVVRAIKMAAAHKLIIRNDNGSLSPNKHYDQWVPFTRIVIRNDNAEATVIKSDNDKPLSETITTLSETITPVIRNDNKSLSETIPTIENKDTNKRNYTKENTRSPKGSRAKPINKEPIIKGILLEMEKYLGFPDKRQKNPIANYGMEGQVIKKMLGRKYTKEDILKAWKYKVDIAGGDVISMVWVNADIGKDSFWRKVNGTQTTKPRFDRRYSHPPV